MSVKIWLNCSYWNIKSFMNFTVAHELIMLRIVSNLKLLHTKYTRKNNQNFAVMFYFEWGHAKAFSLAPVKSHESTLFIFFVVTTIQKRNRYFQSQINNITYPFGIFFVFISQLILNNKIHISRQNSN